jgi:hypothetical protein
MGKFSMLILSAAAAMIVASVWAGDQKPGQPGVGPINPGKPISWEELKARCLHPEQFDVQRAPQNIKIQCTDTRLVWAASAPGEIPLPGQRRVTSGVFADKFFVNAEVRHVPVFSKSGSCLRFKEVEENLTVERAVSCDEILAIKGDLSDFCSSASDSAKAANPKLLEVRETGNGIDTCGGPSVQHGGKPGPK